MTSACERVRSGEATARGLEQPTQPFARELAIAQDLREQPRTDCFASVHRNRGRSPIGVAQQVMATFDSEKGSPQETEIYAR